MTNTEPAKLNEEELAEYVKMCPEIEVFMMIDGLGYMSWRMRHDAPRDLSRGHLVQEEYDSMMKVAEDCDKRANIVVKAVERFGVSPLRVTEYNDFWKKDMERMSDQYRKWYHWWKDYIKSMTHEEWRECDRAVCSRQYDPAKYRPKGDWRDHVVSV